MTIPFTHVISSSIDGYLYLPRGKTLVIRFKNGTDYYAYADVGQDVAKALEDAPSKGKFIHHCVKGCFKWERFDEEELKEAFRRERKKEKRTKLPPKNTSVSYQVFLERFPHLASSLW